MKTAETLLACCVVGLACFIGGQSVGLRTAPAQNEAAGAIDERGPPGTRGDRIAVDSGTIVPRAGMALLFQHRVLHEGAPVRSGVKYVLRSDLMYRRVIEGDA